MLKYALIIFCENSLFLSLSLYGILYLGDTLPHKINKTICFGMECGVSEVNCSFTNKRNAKSQLVDYRTTRLIYLVD